MRQDDIKSDIKGKGERIEIRCDRTTKIGFKKIAAEFDDQEHVIKWMIENFEMFRGLRSIELRKDMLKHGVL